MSQRKEKEPLAPIGPVVKFLWGLLKKAWKKLWYF
jgi:hypothetical protein